jgi:hypothetical protein
VDAGLASTADACLDAARQTGQALRNDAPDN